MRRRLRYQYENEREDVQAVVPRGAQRILDLGCSSGALGAALKRRQGASVTGIELDADYADDAAERLDRVITGDLEQLLGGDEPPDLGTFDCVIAADVLEHLRDPWLVMRRAAEYLRPGGSAVVSLPNIRFWETFWQVGYRANWPRRDHGIFDRTHLRWFTIGDVRGLLDQAGFDVSEEFPQYRLKTSPSSADKHLRLLDATKNLKQFFVFQYVVRGELRSS